MGEVNAESRRAATPAPVLAAMLGVSAACWVIAAWLMDGMDMGVATRPGSFGFFCAVWVTMMAAMMLPGAAPAVARHARARGRARAAPPFAGRSEEHTSELQSQFHLVCRLLLEKKKENTRNVNTNKKKKKQNQ